jgi:hypothetical protein
MNIVDHIFESLETIFWVKIFKLFDADPESGNLFDPGSGMEKNRIRDKKNPGSAKLHTSNLRIMGLFGDFIKHHRKLTGDILFSWSDL